MFLKHSGPLSGAASSLRRMVAHLLAAWSGQQMRELWLFARRRLREESLPQVAGSLTFATVFALVPLLTLALAIFTTFPLFNTLRASLEHYFVQSVMPREISNTILSYLTQFATQATRLSAVGAVTLVATSLMMMALIERALNRIWRVRSERRWHRRILVYWAIVTLGPVLIGVSLTITSQVFLVTIGLVGGVPALFYTAVSVLVTTGAFTLLYVSVPNRYVDWRDAAWGGLLAALAFELAKRGFAVFIQQVPAYSKIYGALAALPLFLLWIYLSWMITLSGALLAAALPVVKYERWWHDAVPGGAFVDAMAILRTLHLAREQGASALVAANDIRSATRLGFDEMESLLEKMLAQGWVGRVNIDAPVRVQWGKRVSEGSDHWVLLANLHQLTLADVYRLFVFGGVPINAGIGSNLARDASAGRTDAGRTDAGRTDAGRTDADRAGALLARQVEMAVEQGLGTSVAQHFGAA
jgi:membrane protein